MKIIAPAKLNLFLHITGRRDDGYHLLESLFVFTEFGDEITLIESDTLSLTIDGLFQSVLSNESIENNLVYRAALLLKEKYAVKIGAKIHLKKNIPVGAGLGGGSSDAAGVLKGLNQFWNLSIDEKTLMQIGLSLGADIPACIAARSAVVSGIGEIINPITLSDIPFVVLLVNPNKPLSTPAVFQQYRKGHFAFTKPLENEINFFKSVKNHNDLESAAITLMPEIQTLLTILKQQPDCLLMRMSGSGPTCFGLFQDLASAKLAEKKIRKLLPACWIQLSSVL